MYNPTYLSLSRHNIYYFRFPLPPTLNSCGQSKEIKLSLQTRCPQEALHLSRSLVNFVHDIINHPAVSSMNYQDIRELLKNHFTQKREKMKAVINRKGQFSEAFIETCRMNEQWANDALEYEDYEDIGTNEDIDTLVSDYSLDIKPDTKEYELFRTEYIKAFRDYNKSLVDFNKHYDGYSFSDHRTTQSITPKVPNVKLADVIEKYIQNGLQRRNWTDKTAKSYRSELNLILEYMGQDSSLYLTKEDMNKIADMLSKIPKGMKGIQDCEGLSIDELMALDEAKYPRMSLKNQKKYIANYAAFFKWAGVSMMD